MNLLSRLFAMLIPGRSLAPAAPADAAYPGAAQPIAEGVAAPLVPAGAGGLPGGLSGHDLDVLTRTLWGEARGEPRAGQVAVVHVVRNRVLHRRTSAAVECQRPWQFSCWNAGDPNREPMLALRVDDPEYLALRDVAEEAWASPDTTQGARHYYNPWAASPAWAKHPKARVVMTVGQHVFLRDVP